MSQGISKIYRTVTDIATPESHIMTYWISTSILNTNTFIGSHDKSSNMEVDGMH